MKFPFALFLLLDIPYLKGQQKINKFDHILLRFNFPSFYNSYGKFCCKLYPGGCYKLLDSTGYTCDFLNGRVTITENDGWIEFKISDVQFSDGGYYRCIVLGTQNQLYNDYFVEVYEVSDHPSQPQPLLTTTIKTSNTSKISDSIQDNRNSPRLWISGQSVAVIASIIVIIFITVVIAVVCCRVKAKRKQPEKYGENLHESLKEDTPETSVIVYTAVDFRAHQMPTEVYANLSMHSTQGKAPNSNWSAERDGMVEYSTLAVHSESM